MLVIWSVEESITATASDNLVTTNKKRADGILKRIQKIEYLFCEQCKTFLKDFFLPPAGPLVKKHSYDVYPSFGAR